MIIVTGVIAILVFRVPRPATPPPASDQLPPFLSIP